MMLRNVISIQASNAFMIRLPTNVPPDRPPKPFLFAYDEVSLNRASLMSRKKRLRPVPELEIDAIHCCTRRSLLPPRRCWRRRGPTRFTIEAVAKSAGCGKPTIYRWWPSPPALLLEVFEQVLIKSWLPHEGKDLAKDLAAPCDNSGDSGETSRWGPLFRLILSEMMLEKEGARYLREVFIPRRQAFTAIAFQAAKDRGEIPPETDIKFLIDLLVWLFALPPDNGTESTMIRSPTELAPPLPSLRGTAFAILPARSVPPKPKVRRKPACSYQASVLSDK